MPEPLTFRTVLEGLGPHAAVILSDEQLATIGHGAKTPAVRVTVNGGYTFAGRVGRMKGRTLLGFNQAVRKAAGVEAGEEIEVSIVLDDAPREVEVPNDLTAALDADPEARKGFDALAYSHRKEYARWVSEAKKAETRERRIEQTLAGAREGKPR